MDSLPATETQYVDHEPASAPKPRAVNYFKEWARNGFRVIPVIPGGAETVPGCDPGKTPGHIHKGGKWGPLKGWRTIEPTPELLEKWHRQGANIGLPRGDAFMIDIDAYEEAQADRIEALALEMLGPAPCRVGSWPKRALLYRADGDVSMVPKVLFASAGGTNGKGQVEIPAQVVVQGRHAAGHEYTWPRKPKPLDKLSTVTHADLVAFMDAVAGEMPDADFSGGAAPKGAVDQHLLVAPDLAHFERAVKALPNTTANAPDYDSMIKVMYAIDAGCGDDKALSNELVHHWCAKWHDYDQEITEGRWQRMQSVDKRVGARFVYQMVAEHVSDPGVSWEDAWLEDLPPEPEREAPDETFRVLTVADLRARPPAEWLIERHIPKQSVGFLYSRPGAGKSFLALDMCLHIATGRSHWHDDPLTPGEIPRVLYIAAEGSYGFLDRIEAWEKKHGLAVGPAFMMIEETINFMKAEDVVRLKNTVRANGGRFDLVVVDTVSRSLPGADENLQKDMTLFVAACEAVKRETGGAVMGVHHAGKSGDMRGSTVLLGAGDFVFRIDRKAGATVGSLVCEKQKEAPDGWEEAYAFERVALPETAQGRERSSLVPVRCFESIGPEGRITPALSASILRAIDDAWRAGEPWSLAPQSKRFFARYAAEEFGLKVQQAEELVTMWVSMGVVIEDTADRKRRIKGLKVVGGVGQVVQNDGIFG